MTAADEHYRRDGETMCIDLRVRQIRQIFDMRDPAPFKERDLDSGVVEYLTEATEEVRRGPLRIEVFVSDEIEPSLDAREVRSAILSYFQHAELALGLRIRGHLRQGQIATLVGLTVLTLFLLAAEAIDPASPSTWKRIVREGLVIGGWVAIWRPVEHFLYDWWPFVEERRTLRRLNAAEVVVHYGRGGPEPKPEITTPPPA